MMTAPFLEPHTCQNDDCDEPARLYPAGWLCAGHRPAAMRAAALAAQADATTTGSTR